MSEPTVEENLERVKEAFERWNSGEREVDLETIDPEIELRSPLASTRGVPYRGHEGFRQWLDDIDEQFELWELRVEEWKPLADGRVFGLGEIHARGRGSGVELDQPLAWLFTFREGRVFRYEAFYDHEEGRRAAGIDD